MTLLTPPKSVKDRQTKSGGQVVFQKKCSLLLPEKECYLGRKDLCLLPCCSLADDVLDCSEEIGSYCPVAEEM